jgi:hypothetical protein
VRKPFLIVTLLAIVLSSCLHREASDGPRSQALWYVLDRGRFTRIGSIRNLSPGTLLPWTYQERVADIAYEQGKIIIGINGFGVAFLDAEKIGTPAFQYFFDESLFSRNTLTTIIPYGDEAVCHYYFNSSLNDTGQTRSRNCNFAFFPVEETMGRFVPYFLPMQAKRQGYEAVGFLPKTKLTWYIEWKKSEKVTRFDYSTYRIAGRREATISRDTYRKAFAFRDISDHSTEPSIRVLCRRIIGERGLPEADTTYHFIVKRKDTNIAERYASGASFESSDEEYEIENVPMFRDDTGVYGFSGSSKIEGILFSSGTSVEMGLPDLPERYSYSGFFVHERFVILQWEESSFYKTGNAGIAILEIHWD